VALTSGGRILIIEDEADLALALKARLESAGYEVHTECNGSVALSYAAEHWPDLAILDATLPDLEGYEVCRELHNLCEACVVPVVMFTGRDEPSDELHGFASGAEAYLTKRCTPDELLETVESVLHDLGEPATR